MQGKALPGFRDFYPEELALRNHIFAVWRSVARRYGFEEYDGPPLEPLEIYTQKSGEEIVEQLYAFEDKGGRKVARAPRPSGRALSLASQQFSRPARSPASGRARRPRCGTIPSRSPSPRAAARARVRARSPARTPRSRARRRAARFLPRAGAGPSAAARAPSRAS